jgi:hypothetical protein
MTLQLDLRGVLPLMGSASIDHELRRWPRWALPGGSAPTFVRAIAKAVFLACAPDDLLLRLVLVELELRRHRGKLFKR